MPIATLCINEDITNLSRIRDLLEQQLRPGEPETIKTMSGRPAAGTEVPGDSGAPEGPPSSESFAHGVPQLAELLIDQAISEVGVPVDLMKKQHKLLVVRELERRGFFLIREAVEDAARALAVTRYTIYNYLNEIEAE
ncbi:MAG: helix-turn-helix domain-containing protein, partial [Candidatus Dormibacteraeota bacterium]|nr:helix-turn-helix domain-containing protein [Candidatus Dormibacteraeota bacterium]